MTTQNAQLPSHRYVSVAQDRFEPAFWELFLDESLASFKLEESWFSFPLTVARAALMVSIRGSPDHLAPLVISRASFSSRACR
jgi:hypothetical protein